MNVRNKKILRRSGITKKLLLTVRKETAEILGAHNEEKGSENLMLT